MREDRRRRRPGEVGAVGQRAVERHGGGEARFAGGEQLPGHRPAEAEADDGELGAGRAALQLVEPGAQVGDEALGGALPSAAVASPSLGRLAVPPSSESRSIASAL